MRNQQNCKVGNNFLYPSPIKIFLSQESLFLQQNFQHQKKFGEWGWEGPPKIPTFLLKHFWKKSEESRPPLNQKIMGVYFLHFFSRSLLSPRKTRKQIPIIFQFQRGSTFFTFFQKCFNKKVGILGGPSQPHSQNFFDA